MCFGFRKVKVKNIKKRPTDSGSKVNDGDSVVTCTVD